MNRYEIQNAAGRIDRHTAGIIRTAQEFELARTAALAACEAKLSSLKALTLPELLAERKGGFNGDPSTSFAAYIVDGYWPCWPHANDEERFDNAIGQALHHFGYYIANTRALTIDQYCAAMGRKIPAA